MKKWFWTAMLGIIKVAVYFTINVEIKIGSSIGDGQLSIRQSASSNVCGHWERNLRYQLMAADSKLTLKPIQ